MSERIKVLKTYKIFIGGKFPRTESGRYYQTKNNGIPIANICLSSRKDIKNAVAAARKAFSGWSTRTAFNRSQILYRIAEMLETRKSQFLEELVLQGWTNKNAELEIHKTIDRIIYFAGWADKINQVFGSVNPVATSHFNFTMLEPMGVVGLITNEETPLLGIASCIIPSIVSGNTVVVLASEKAPLSALTFAEVISNSDVPPGVVNILSGNKQELSPHIYSHMDVNAIGDFSDLTNDEIKLTAVENLKRIRSFEASDISNDNFDSPYVIKDFMEAKTTWHPIESGFANSNSY
jgi:acyl-CoA reductase-like NAD-dependent aldehyde dehydrogenase